MSANISYNQLIKLARQCGFVAVGSLSISKINRKNLQTQFKSILSDNPKSLVVLFHPYPKLNKCTKFYDYPEEIKLAYFAQIFDYHRIVKQRISELAGTLLQKPYYNKAWWGVDDHPLPEKELAQQAKIGFKGKNKLLILPEYGSFGSLGILVSPLKIKKDKIEDKSRFKSSVSTEEYCKNCRKCINNCPVSALKINEKLNTDKCISALTQKQGRLSWELVANIENHFWGCDICQLVCPYNNDKNYATQKKFEDVDLLKYGWPEIGDLTVKEILLLHKKDMPRGWDGFVFNWLGKRILIRNMLIVLGNNRTPIYWDIIKNISNHPSSVLRYYAYYCLYRWHWQENKKRATEFLKKKAFQETDKINEQILYKTAGSKEEFIK